MKNRMNKHSTGIQAQDAHIYYFTEPSCTKEVTRLLCSCHKKKQVNSAGDRVDVDAIRPGTQSYSSPDTGENTAKECASSACLWRRLWN